MKRSIRFCAVFLVLLCGFLVRAAEAGSSGELRLHVGWARVDITPERPVALIGQLHKRISERVRDPLTATALAMETRHGGISSEQAILVSCDVLYIRKSVLEKVRETLRARLPDFDADKLVLNATHTHTGPGFGDNDFGTLYDVSKDEGVMPASEYATFFVERVAQAAAVAWVRRQPSGVSWALGHAVVGMNRRVRYFDGEAKMYGPTAQSDFAGLEGYEDHGVEMLLFWADDGALTGMVVNLPCTAQETENLNEISADFWHDVRQTLRERLAQDVHVLPQCAAAGDLSPHLLYRAKAEEAMTKRRGLSNRQEIARRIVDAVQDVLPVARDGVTTCPVFRHAVVRATLPPARSVGAPFYTTDTTALVELHVLRLGDVAIATNPFELYVDYGVRIKARSPAVLTMLVQLSCQHCGYLPTEKAIAGGGYSADRYIVGPKGGQVLVDETVRQIEAFWK